MTEGRGKREGGEAKGSMFNLRGICSCLRQKDNEIKRLSDCQSESKRGRGRERGRGKGTGTEQAKWRKRKTVQAAEAEKKVRSVN